MPIPLKTDVEIAKTGIEISYRTPMLFIGSCFSDNIGSLLESNKFDVLKNPFGVLYNPLSIATGIKLALNNIQLKSEDLIHHNNLWHSFHFHGSFSSPNKNEVIEKANETIQQTHLFLKSANFLIVTFGTAWVYKHLKNNIVVSNCHKIPEKEFQRLKLNIDEIVQEWNSLIADLHKINPELRLIFTVSPIRHLKDGAHENQLSKSTLLLAIERITNENKGSTTYFPSYEIVMDELRDYRFYAPDMIHMSEVAIQYIFEKFKLSFFTTELMNCLKEVQKITLAKEHRILTNNPVEIKKFAQSNLSKIEILELKYPEINFLSEKSYFENLSEKE